MNVPFLDLRAAYLELRPEIDAAISRVLASGCYILGPEVEAFENEWASYCEARYAVGVGNGLDALTLALRALEIGPGDEVIVPSNTYIATWLAVSAVGAKPVPVEPDPITYNIDPTRIAAAITPATRVLLPVHLYGQPADLDPILALARTYKLFVIEDAAQAHGARYKGKRIGSHGHLVCWSFYPGKNLGALGDAGAITTNNCELADRIRVLRNYGSRIKYTHDIHGVNSRIDPIQAAVLRVKLKFLDEWNARRREVAASYIRDLARCPLTLPYTPRWADPVWHLFVIRISNRDHLQRWLYGESIETLVHYPIPPEGQKCYGLEGHTPSKSALSMQIADKVISLPIGPHLGSQQCRKIIEKIRDQFFEALH